MADDKPTLTRRRVLGGMATIGVAGALGAGAWAGYSDPEMANITAQAGTLDAAIARVGEPNSSRVNGNTLTFNVHDLAPGETVQTSAKIFNLGTVQAHGAGVELDIIDSTEGSGPVNNPEKEEDDQKAASSNPESETDQRTSNGGELDDQLQIVSWYNDSTDLDIFGTKGDFSPQTQDPSEIPSDHFISLKKAQNLPEQQVGGFSLPGKDGNSENFDTLRIYLRYPDLDPSKNNQAMGDTVSFDYTVTLYQNDVSQTSP